VTLPHRTVVYRAICDAAARFVGLPAWVYGSTIFTGPDLVEAMIRTESGGDPRARRYEPHQDRATRTDVARDPDTADKDDGDLEDDCSYGLMQVMGFNARALLGVRPGTPMSFAPLYRPLLNISLGLTIFTGELAAVAFEVSAGKLPGGRTVERALARYNGGPTGDDDTNGAFRLQAYIDRVARHAFAVRREKESA